MSVTHPTALERKRSLVLVVGEPLGSSTRGQVDWNALPYAFEEASNGLEALTRLRSGGVDLVLIDLEMREAVMDALREIRPDFPNLPVVVVSGTPSALVAMESGATEFLASPVTFDDLLKAIGRTMAGHIAECNPATRNPGPNTGFVAKNTRMAAIQAILGQVGPSDVPVLIQGETGSGKEVVARALHANSRRANKPFFKLNCAALPSELVESELFGYERGAFTGASQRKAGIFEMADGGSILLDEIGDMDVRLQAKLLQVLQDYEFQRIGGKETIKVDVRVIGATHRDLEKQIDEGTFREDLYYRLNVVNLVVPPLRDRKDELFDLMDVLLKKHATTGMPIPTITPELRAVMLAWHWPGNVRELENFVRRLLIFRDPALMVRELKQCMARRHLNIAPPVIADGLAVDTRAQEQSGDVSILAEVGKAQQRAECDVILAALMATRWNRKRAAAMLNVEYKNLLYKMKKLGMDQKPAIASRASQSGHWQGDVSARPPAEALSPSKW